MSELKDWTVEELVLELRHRERRERTRSTGRGPGSSRGRAAELAEVPTARLAGVLRDRQRVIYGIDNRDDIYQVKSAKVRTLASCVAALVKTSDLRKIADGSCTLATTSYRQEYDLCGNEPFASQPLGCFCSGFLVARNVVATAGHCVKGPADLRTTRFVFGWRMLDAARARTTFPAEDVYTGKSIVGRELTPTGADWALVKLDREVTGRMPLAVRTSGKVGNTAKVFVIGHPSGLPAKYAPGARVRDNTPASHFVANLDTYGGNSGSPVFSTGTKQVEGILVRGENDYVSNGTCQVSQRCPTTGCRGEDVTRASVWAARVPKAKGASPAEKRAKDKRARPGGRARRTR
jgi:hypothetical protein